MRGIPLGAGGPRDDDGGVEVVSGAAGARQSLAEAAAAALASGRAPSCGSGAQEEEQRGQTAAQQHEEQNSIRGRAWSRLRSPAAKDFADGNGGRPRRNGAALWHGEESGGARMTRRRRGSYSIVEGKEIMTIKVGLKRGA